jgi:hypothetical protein
MNERIEELMFEAGRFADENTGSSDRSGMWVYQYSEKFAELIVWECVNNVDKTGFVFNEQPQYNDKQNALVSEGFFWALELVKQQINQHFGVEE